MQEEVNEKTVSLCITGGKVTVRLLKQAMMRFLAAVEKEKAEKARKQQTKAPGLHIDLTYEVRPFEEVERG